MLRSSGSALVWLGTSLSLRRHDPDQVRRVTALRRFLVGGAGGVSAPYRDSPGNAPIVVPLGVSVKGLRSAPGGGAAAERGARCSPHFKRAHFKRERWVRDFRDRRRRRIHSARWFVGPHLGAVEHGDDLDGLFAHRIGHDERCPTDD